MIKDKTLIIEALKIFCSKDKYHVWMNTLCTDGVNLVGTDGHSLAGIKYSKVELVYPQAPLCESNAARTIGEVMDGHENMSVTISTDNIKKALEYCMVTVPVVYEVECNICEGEGEVEYTFNEGRFSAGIMGDCPKCEGTGRIETNHPELTERVLTASYYIKVGVCYISARVLGKLAVAASILNAENVRLVHQINKTAASIFEVGDITVVLMPVHFNSNNYYDLEKGEYV